MIWFSKQIILLLLFMLTAFAQVDNEKTHKLCNSPELYDNHPILCAMLDRLYNDGDIVANEMTSWAETHGLLASYHWDYDSLSASHPSAPSSDSQLPIVFAHGMGDSCFNPGFQRLVKHTSDTLGGIYSVCIPTGKDQKEDTTNGYFLNMDASVDVFAEAISKDEQLKNGFHAIGLSQGNNVIRGYIARYNKPPVDTFISINGVNAGVGAVPHCRPSALLSKSTRSGTSFCDLLMEQASKRAYTEFAQEHSFQANYWRDPRLGEKENYEKFSQLAHWNNEGHSDSTLNENFAKTNQFVWIMATQDGMVWPREGEHWGAPDPSAPLQKVLPRKETEWYINDLFGLRTAEEAGKNHYLSFVGDHLQFSMDEYNNWITTYLKASDSEGGEEMTTSVQ
jgi:palmitoyl-protein thioesterase